MTVYFGERDRSGGAFLADLVVEAAASAGVDRSAVLRGTEGFGQKHRLQSSQLLSLSEDLPMIVVAVGDAVPVRAAADRVRSLAANGLVLVEKQGGPNQGSTGVDIWLRRGQRLGDGPAHVGVVRLLARHGATAAVTLLGVDGSAGRRRERARFFSSNTSVPLIVSATGPAAALARAGAQISALLPGASLDFSSAPEPAFSGGWRRLTVYGSESPIADGTPLHSHLIRTVRESGGSGATVLTGIHGFTGDAEPRGDSFLQVRRRVPVITEIVDTWDNCERWVEVAHGLGGENTALAIAPVEVIPV